MDEQTDKGQQFRSEAVNVDKAKPHLSFEFPLSEQRKHAISLLTSETVPTRDITNLLQSQDIIEIYAGLHFLGRKTDLTEQEKDQLSRTLTSVIEKHPYAKVRVMEAAYVLGEKAYSLLQAEDETDSPDEQFAARVSTLKARIIEDPDNAFNILKQEAEAIPDRATWDHHILIEVAKAINPPNKALIAAYLTFPDKGVADAAKEALDELDPNVQIPPGQYPDRQLLTSQNPMEATPHREALARRMARLEELNQELKEKFGDAYTGFIVFGGTVKGYFNVGKISDLDLESLGSSADIEAAIKAFCKAHSNVDMFGRHKADSLGLDTFGYHHTDPNTEDPDRLGQTLFRGVFFGNQDRLREEQRKLVNKISPKEWDLIRLQIMSLVTFYDNDAARLGVSSRTLEAMNIAAMLSRVPPPLEEVKRQLA